MSAATGVIILRADNIYGDDRRVRRTLTRPTMSGRYVVTVTDRVTGATEATEHDTLLEAVRAFGGSFWTTAKCDDTHGRITQRMVEDLLADGWTADGAFAHVEGTCDRAVCCGWDD